MKSTLMALINVERQTEGVTFVSNARRAIQSRKVIYFCREKQITIIAVHIELVAAIDSSVREGEWPRRSGGERNENASGDTRNSEMRESEAIDTRLIE